MLPRALARGRVSAYAGGVASITLAALAARLALLGVQPLWRDEAFTAVVVTRPLGQMLAAVRADSAPPLWYLAEHAVTAVVPGTVGLRLLPAIAGALSVPVAAALGRRIAGARAGLLTAAFAAAAPALLLSAIDARMYALATALVLASTLVLWRAAERPRPGRWVLHGVLLALALHTDYFAVLVIPAQLLALRCALGAPWRSVRAAALASLAAVVSLTPWLVAAAPQLSHAAQPFWIPPLSFASVTGGLVAFFVGPPVDAWVPLRPLLQCLQGLAGAAGILAVALLAWKRAALPATGRRALRFCATCGGGALVLLVALSFWRPLVDGHYASVLWGPLFALVGAGLALLRFRAVLTAGLVATGSASLALSLAATHPDTAAAATWLGTRPTAHDLVDAHPSEYLLLLRYAPQRVLAGTVVVQPDVAWYWGTAAYPVGAILPAVPDGVTGAGGAIYYVRQPDDPPPAALPRGYTAAATRCWTGVCVVTYRA